MRLEAVRRDDLIGVGPRPRIDGLVNSERRAKAHTRAAWLMSAHRFHNSATVALFLRMAHEQSGAGYCRWIGAQDGIGYGNGKVIYR